MLNFTVGPVQSNDNVRKIGAEQVPYFRTEEFSNIMKENEKMIKEFAKASDDSKVVFITGSGTASMEASVMNTLDENDNVLVVNGGSFGARFVKLLKLHNISYDEIKLDFGKTLTQDDLNKYDGNEYSVFMVNVHETSTGVKYDLELIHEYCIKYNLFLVVDAISSFLADSINMQSYGIDLLITGSQKALACPPGISLIVLGKKALERVNRCECKCMYFDLKDALSNAERGQTPFTPAVGILLQINERLKEIQKNGGVDVEVKRVGDLATDFRNKIKDLPFEIVSNNLSNAVTPLKPLTASAYDIFLTLKDEYNIWICPNGGDLKDKVFRVGHIGYLSTEDNDILIEAFNDMKERNFI